MFGEIYSSKGYTKEPSLPPSQYIWLLALIVGLLLLLTGCGSPPKTIPPAPPPPVIAKVIVPVDCEIEQVPLPAYPGDLARLGDDIYTLSRIAMADRRVRIAERDRLRAANKNPCPAAAAPNESIPTK